LLTGRLRLVTRDETVSSSDEIRTTAVREGGAISFLGVRNLECIRRLSMLQVRPR
jgi:hypothetical protein